MNVSIIIPAFNESAAIGALVRQIRGQNLDVVVIDDGSADTTAQEGMKNGATVLRNPKNQGKGFSLIRGLTYALDNNYNAVITMDGDGQHSPEDIPSFANKGKSSSAGIIIGNRMFNPQKMPFVRILTNKFMSWLISRSIKQNVPDTQCGFRLIKKELLEQIKFTTGHFETESEILFQASRLGFKIESVSVRTIYQKEKSQINPFFDTLRFIGFMWRQVWISRS